MMKLDWHAADGLSLEGNARKAAMLEKGSSVVTAGPGAGKTELLAQRADFLLRTGVCRYPHRILAISFKTDAARTLAERVRRRSGIERAARLDSQTFHAFARRIIEMFRPILQGKSALDPGFTVGKERDGRKQASFDELVPLAIDIINKDPMAVRMVRMTYTDVFLDEFQDCTDGQYKLIRELFLDSSIRLIAVGDTKQRIMGWAGALDGVFERFASDFKAERITLYQNYRSKPRIRRVQNAMVRVMEPSAAVDDAELLGDTGTVKVINAASCVHEAKMLVSCIQAWISEGVPPHEIAILVPREPQFICQPLMAELIRCGVPFREEQNLQDLSTEPLAELIVNFLRVLGSTPAPDAYAALLLRLSGSDDGGGGMPGWLRFIDGARLRLGGATARSRASALRNVVDSMVQRYGAANLAALSVAYSDPSSISQLVNSVCDRLEELLDEESDISGALSRFAAEGTVRIMSFHKCKGMEFEAVVMPGTEAQEWWGKSDDRSAFFVGVSRAKDHLIVSYAGTRATPRGFPSSRVWKEKRSPHAEFVAYARVD